MHKKAIKAMRENSKFERRFDMKESKYNIYVEHKGQQLIFNSRTIATAALDLDAMDILDAVRHGMKIEKNDLAEQMKQVGFLIDDGTDELQQLELDYNLSKYQELGLGLVISPTMVCNFACPYCFEGLQKGVMSEQIQEEIISLVDRFARKGQDIHVTWFGGEPLLAKEIIYNMSERILDICQQAGVKYEAGIITNGYLLDEETVIMLKKYNVGSSQVTLDGVPKTHNAKRKLKNDSGKPTFDTIVENVICAKEHGMQVAIRINVDRETEKDLEQLLDMMIERNLGEELYLGCVQGNTENSKSFIDNCLNEREFARIHADFENKKFDRKMTTEYPMPTRMACGADYIYSFLIDADGYMYKCWNDIGIKEYSIGLINDYDSIMQNPNTNCTKFMTWSPFQFKQCRECKLLPICMGGCQYNGRQAGKPICENWKYELEKYIKLICNDFCQ